MKSLEGLLVNVSKKTSRFISMCGVPGTGKTPKTVGLSHLPPSPSPNVNHLEYVVDILKALITLSLFLLVPMLG